MYKPKLKKFNTSLKSKIHKEKKLETLQPRKVKQNLINTIKPEPPWKDSGMAVVEAQTEVYKWLIHNIYFLEDISRVKQ